MSQRGSLFLFLLLVFLFLISSQAIVKVKVQELRFQLSKEQLLNYELSSKVLKEKIRQMMASKDDFTNEIKTNVIESNIMNSKLGSSDIKLSITEKFGLSIINFVRFISLKSPLALVEDQNDMIKIQLGFYLERTRKYANAIKQYKEVKEKFTFQDSDEFGFVLLHLGFCQAMTGETKEAIETLKDLESKFLGTQFADNARVIINLLEEGLQKTEDIYAKYSTNSERAVALFETGKYSETLQNLDEIKKEERSTDQNYMRARSLEELGRTTEAVSEYIDLTKKTDDVNVAKKANRRLLLIGNIYEKNETLANYSKEKAQSLGDTEVVKQVESGTQFVAKSQIVEKIMTEDASQNQAIDKKEFEAIKEQLNEINKAVEEKQKEVIVAQIEKPKQEEEAKKKEEEAKKIEAPKPQIRLYISVTLIDGRGFQVQSVDFVDDQVKFQNGIFSWSAPEVILEELIPGFEGPKPDKKPKLVISLNNGTQVTSNSLKHSNGQIFVDGGSEFKIGELKSIDVK